MGGSSPHARGAPDLCPRLSCTRGDHPRMRGEHSAPRGNDGMTLGSSPHARGARIADQVLASFTGDHPRMRGEHEPADRRGHDHDGIIPACAGSTAAGATLTFIRSGSSPHARGARERRLHRPPSGRDHPRMRGEHALGYGGGFSITGSSPHARGARLLSCRSHHSPRDHPRMRGEHGRAAEPHAHLHGIIPACAGSTARQLLGRSL